MAVSLFCANFRFRYAICLIYKLKIFICFLIVQREKPAKQFSSFESYFETFFALNKRKKPCSPVSSF